MKWLLVAETFGLGCIDNSCLYRTRIPGHVGTNSICRCIDRYPRAVERFLTANYAEALRRLGDQKTPDQNQETMGFPGSPQGDDSWK